MKKKQADQKGKGKEILFSDRGSDIEESVVGSETADEEESSFKIPQPGPRLYSHLEDSQDLNLYPSQYDHSRLSVPSVRRCPQRILAVKKGTFNQNSLLIFAIASLRAHWSSGFSQVYGNLLL